MGIIVGTVTRWECDEPGCRQHSPERHDQQAAHRVAAASGWSKSESTGRVQCPECRVAKRFGTLDAATWAVDTLLEELVRYNPADAARYRTIAKRT